MAEPTPVRPLRAQLLRQSHDPQRWDIPRPAPPRTPPPPAARPTCGLVAYRCVVGRVGVTGDGGESAGLDVNGFTGDVGGDAVGETDPDDGVFNPTMRRSTSRTSRACWFVSILSVGRFCAVSFRAPPPAAGGRSPRPTQRSHYRRRFSSPCRIAQQLLGTP